MLQLSLLFLEPRFGSGLFLLLESCQFSKGTAPLLFVMNLGLVRCLQFAFKFKLKTKNGNNNKCDKGINDTLVKSVLKY